MTDDGLSISGARESADLLLILSFGNDLVQHQNAQ